MVEKLEKDGMIAVAVSYGYGAGWSTWNSVFEEGKYDEAADLCDELEMGYPNGAFDVKLEWVPKGTMFRIGEYDGYESLEVKENLDWWKA